MDSHRKYDAQAGTIDIESITSDKGNQEILRQLKCNDPNLIRLRVDVERVDVWDYVPQDADDLGWLGYFIGKSKILRELFVCPTDALNSQLGSFCGGINRNTSLEKFFFEDLFEGEIFPLLGPFFGENCNLAEIGILRGCYLGTEGCRSLSLAIAGCSKSLKRFTMTNSYFPIDIDDNQMADIILALAAHPQLEKLVFRRWNLERNASVALAFLLRNTASRLHTLDLEGSRIGNAGMSALVQGLADCELLHTLDLRYNDIGDAGLQALTFTLARGSRLKVLDLSQNPSITARGYRVISTLLRSPDSCLEKLHVSSVGDEAALAFADALADNGELKELSLWFNTITPEGWSAFSRVLCDTSNVNKTFLSNHTLRDIAGPGVPDSARDHLELACGAGRRKVATTKILKHHPQLDMRPFFRWGFKLLPLAVGWHDGAAASHTGPGDDIGRRKLSAIYQFIRGFPVGHVETRRRALGQKRSRPPNGAVQREQPKLQRML